MKIREDVYERAVNESPRDLFTICHEFGHALLHDSASSIELARGKESVKAYEDPEWQANTFAAELLAPSDVIVGMSIEEVAEVYKCSMQVAKIQLEKSNIIN